MVSPLDEVEASRRPLRPRMLGSANVVTARSGGSSAATVRRHAYQHDFLGGLGSESLLAAVAPGPARSAGTPITGAPDEMLIFRPIHPYHRPGRGRAGGHPSGPLRRRLTQVFCATVLALLTQPAAALADGTLRVTVTGGVGHVRSDPAGIDCPRTCAASFPPGSTVTLNATPAAGYKMGIVPWDSQSGSPCALANARAERCAITIPDDGNLVVEAALRPAAELDVIVNERGRVTATVENPGAGEVAEVVCAYGECPMHFLPGRVVTLTAEPDTTAGPSVFGAWSDDRCPPSRVCRLRLDADRQAAVASFSPQRVVVRLSVFDAPGTVTSTPPGLACEPGNGATAFCIGEFDLFSEVVLTAHGVAPVWGQSVDDDSCDAIAGATCHVTADSHRDVGVRFGGQSPQPGHPSTVDVVFRVAKAGDGSGTVRSRSLDCGRTCTMTEPFGVRRTLVADPDPGSRFVRWQGACSSAPTCTLGVGPVTRITAVFARDPGPPGPSSSAGSSAPPSRDVRSRPAKRPLSVRIERVAVHRVGRRRVILLRVRVNAPASVRAELRKRRARVASRTLPMRTGSRLLRLRVPARARRGAYRLRVTARDGAGHVERAERAVRLRR